ncbi:MAG: DUF1573 domain-containing protein [Bacteroidales bacterium]|nr:DUF1573 domain-containing protein [Bacteroidales bacterium]
MNKLSRILWIVLGLVIIGVVIYVFCTDKEVPEVYNPATAESGEIRIQNENAPKIVFEETTYDFGTIIQGEKLTHVFVFTNEGKSDLVIHSAKASCGCTTSTPPKVPIKPGEKGEIKITFDSKSKKGAVDNNVRVAANTYPTITVLHVKANVKTL